MPETKARRRLRWDRLLTGAVVAAVVAGAGWAMSVEFEASPLQSRLFSKLARGFSYSVDKGPNPNLIYPTGGPYDERLGYARLPNFIHSLEKQGFQVTQQARLSPDLRAFINDGGFAVFPEKAQTGLTLTDRSGEVLYVSHHPERVFADFGSIPSLVVATLLFVENRELLDNRYPTRNPAVEWDRFFYAAANVVTSAIDPNAGRKFGGSTLATQIEKYRHSLDGRTNGIEDKLRQIATASVRSYQDGPDTNAARRRIVVDYLNSTPLSARPGFGEVIGLGDGLWAWYGTDLDTATRLLDGPPTTAAQRADAARVFKEVLSLLLAQRRPSHYLLQGRDDLTQLTASYLQYMYDAGVISTELRDQALAAPLTFRKDPPPPSEVSFIDHKATNSARAHLLSLLQIPQTYVLDRLDARVEATLDVATQRRVVAMLKTLTDDTEAARLGLIGERLLRKGEAADVNYSFTLYERGEGLNYLRVQADNLDRPLDLNEGGKFDLGSTAKLRTVVTYLQIVSELHDRYSSLSRTELLDEAEDANDALSRWALQYLAGTQDRSLQAMVDAAMNRKYSANPGEAFFTGRGVHVFSNFDKTYNRRIMPVWEGLRYSVNLVFIRMMRDIIRYYQAEGPEPVTEILAESDHPARRDYLERFADMEGKVFLSRFYRRYRGLSPDDALDLLASRARPMPHRLATVFRSVRPDAELSEFSAFMKKRLPGTPLDEKDLLKLYVTYGTDRFNLHDRGYIAKLHPLELWLVNYLQSHQNPTRAEVMTASSDTRQEVYAWLFKSKRKGTADTRIRIIAEEEAFKRLHTAWAAVGYPFDSLVPSYATAIGSSADRPAALAELVGIILNDGIRQPVIRIDRIDFGEGTPYETHLQRSPEAGTRVFPTEVAIALRRALMDVVANGTARRAANAFVQANGQVIPVGGKTGTGDESFGHASLVREKEVGRAAAFCFFIGSRYFGVITAHVPGEIASRYKFTSALPSQVLKALGPTLMPLIGEPPGSPPASGKVVAEVESKARRQVP